MEIQRGGDNDFALWALIIQSRDVLFRARDNELNQFGITAVEARALFIVNLIGEQATPAMISRWMLREHNTVTALLNRMENKGLINKKKDPEKKNSWNISLTDKGAEAYENSLSRDALREIFAVLTDEERTVLTEALQKVCDQTFKYMMGVPTVP
ncbi:MAG: winged helix DNA-binding protein [Dehalococcoidales bacterium]|nr:winged helix DNA-binding protein [Dehalococcoidales bacterium]